MIHYQSTLYRRSILAVYNLHAIPHVTKFCKHFTICYWFDIGTLYPPPPPKPPSRMVYLCRDISGQCVVMSVRILYSAVGGCSKRKTISRNEPNWGRDSSVGIATRYGLDGPRIESRWGSDFPQPSRPVLGPTQPPVEWVPGLSWGQSDKRQGRGADHPPPSSAEVEGRVELYI